MTNTAGLTTLEHMGAELEGRSKARGQSRVGWDLRSRARSRGAGGVRKLVEGVDNWGHR
jgi:hypothetical protein